MILYLDTSSLVKLYVDEAGSAQVWSLVRGAEAVATSLVAYPEARAAFARAYRQGRLPEESYRRLARAFDEDWGGYAVVALSEPVARLAGDLAERYTLRGFDAIHLASAMTLTRVSAEAVAFSAWDADLLVAAAAEGLALP